MLELILVRHGETESNIRGTYCGWTDVPLTPRGISQTRCTARKLRGTAFDAVYSSPLKRALHTAEIILSENRYSGASRQQPAIICSDSLKEHNFGIWEDLTIGEIRSRYPKEADEWERDWINFTVEGGESALQGYERIAGFLDRLTEGAKQGKILIVAHLGSIRYILIHLLGMKIEDIWRFNTGNGRISRVMINDSGYAYLEALNT